MDDTTELSLASLELDKLEAVVELMFFAAYADGTIDPSERAIFEKNAVTATHGQLRPEIIRAVLRHFEITAKKEDRATRIEAIARKVTDPKVRHAVLALAVSVALADGTLAAEERAFIEQAGAAFGMPKEEVEGLLAPT
jgi:tellurite resistance protein